MKLRSRISPFLLTAAIAAACLLPGKTAWSQSNSLTATKLLKVLEEQAAMMMSGRQFSWTETTATMGGNNNRANTVLEFQFDDKGMLTNGTTESLLLKCRSSSELYAIRRNSQGGIRFEYFAGKGGQFGMADHYTRIFMHHQQCCAFRATTMQFPPLSILVAESRFDVESPGRRLKWTLEKLPPDHVDLILSLETRRYLRATFVLPSLMCILVEDCFSGTTVKAIPGAGTVDGFPFLPAAFRRDGTSGGVQYVATSKMESVKPLDLQEFPAFGPPLGFESMTSKEYMQKMQEKAMQRIGK